MSVPEEIQWCRLRYFGHLQRLDTNVWLRRVNDYVLPSILSKGHPQLHWSHVITKDLKDFNIKKELAHKQAEWQRAIVPRIIQLQEVQPIRGLQAL